jgi:hypothetical protein
MVLKFRQRLWVHGTQGFKEEVFPKRREETEVEMLRTNYRCINSLLNFNLGLIESYVN